MINIHSTISIIILIYSSFKKLKILLNLKTNSYWSLPYKITQFFYIIFFKLFFVFNIIFLTLFYFTFLILSKIRVVIWGVNSILFNILKSIFNLSIRTSIISIIFRTINQFLLWKRYQLFWFFSQKSFYCSYSCKCPSRRTHALILYLGYHLLTSPIYIIIWPFNNTCFMNDFTFYWFH